MVYDELLEELTILARDNPGMSNAHLAAALVDRKGKIISYGFNSSKTHPLQAKFSKNEHAIHLHAEVDAIRNALKMGLDIEGTTMLVARALKDGTPALAKPCEGCQRALVHFGVADVVWTVADEFL